MTFYVTFGQKYRRERHPYFGHPDGYAEVQASSVEVAQAKVSNRYGDEWSNIYTAEQFKPEFYPRGIIEVIH